MKQLSKGKSVLYHLYPGVFITIGFVFLAPLGMGYGFPPQFGMLIAIVLVALPILIAHLFAAKKSEEVARVYDVNGFTNRLPVLKLVLYSLALVVFAFLIWGVTQPVNILLTKNLLGWLPDWYTVQDFAGYEQDKIKATLVLNLLLNGLLAPYVEEFYFRGYLLPRMEVWGKGAWFVSALFFSLYHFWQPYIYFTLVLALLPMTYFVWKTRDLRLAILTHSLLNLVGALLTLGLVAR